MDRAHNLEKFKYQDNILCNYVCHILYIMSNLLRNEKSRQEVTFLRKDKKAENRKYVYVQVSIMDMAS